MTRLTNTSDTNQVIPSKGGARDLAVGATDSFDVSEDNPHVQAKLRAGLIVLAESATDGGEAIEPVVGHPETAPPEAEKPAAAGEASARPRVPTKPATGDQPGGATSTL